MRVFLFLLFLPVASLCGQVPQLMLPVGHNQPLVNSHFLDGDKYVITASRDGTVKCWETASGYVIRSLAAGSDQLSSFGVNETQHLFFTLASGYLKTWDIDSFRLLASYFDPDEKIEQATLSTDGTRIIAWSYGKLTVMDSRNGKQLFASSDTLLLSQPLLNRLSFSPVKRASLNQDGSTIFVQLGDALLIIDVLSGVITKTISPVAVDNGEWVFIPSTNELVCTALRRNKIQQLAITVYDAKTGLQKRSFLQGDGAFYFQPEEHAYRCTSISDSLVVVPEEGGFRASVFNQVTGKRQSITETHHQEPITYTALSIDRSRLLTISRHELFSWDARSGKVIDSFQSTRELYQAAFSPGNTTVVIAFHTGGKLALWNPGKHFSRTLDNHVNTVGAIFTTPQLDTLPGGFMDFQLQGYLEDESGNDVIDRYSHKLVSLENGGLWGVVAEDDFFRVFGLPEDFYNRSYTYDQQYEVQNQDSLLRFTDKRGQTFDVHTSLYLGGIGEDVTSFTISPDNKYLALYKNDPYYPYGWGAAIFDIPADTLRMLIGSSDLVSSYAAQPELLQKWMHTDEVNHIRFSLDSKMAVSASRDGTARVWDIIHDSLLLTLNLGSDVADARFFNQDKHLALATYDGRITVWNLADKRLVYTMALIDSFDQITILPNGFYKTQTSRTRDLYYLYRNRPVSFEQLDARFNRPDQVEVSLQREFGGEDSLLIQALYKAYLKRLEKLGLDERQFNSTFKVPDASIRNRDSIPYNLVSPQLSLHLVASDPDLLLQKLNIWVNGSPVFGQRGLQLTTPRHKIDTVLTITLSLGENRVEAAAINSNGVSSYRMPLMVNYQSVNPERTTNYFIGIGVTHFADKRYDLNYSVKDIRDLAFQFRKKFKTDLVIDTLFDEQVTIDAVKALKQRLLQTSVNDRVIIAYSGHGLLSSELDYYLSTYSIRFDQPEINGLPYSDLEQLTDSIPARRKLLLIDACHSGEVDKAELAAINETAKSMGLKKGLQPVEYKSHHLGMKSSFELMQQLFVGKNTGTTVISAAAGTQFALERGDIRNGVFSFCILDALKKYPSIKVSVLQRLVSQQVEAMTKGLQRPTTRNEQRDMDWDAW